MLVLANLPFALVGGVLAVFATGGWLSIGSLVGFVTLFGITLRNSVMLMAHYEHLFSLEAYDAAGLDYASTARLRLANLAAPLRCTPAAMSLCDLSAGTGTVAVPGEMVHRRAQC